MPGQGTSTWLLAVVAWAACGPACGGPGEPVETAALRLRVAQEPLDPEVRLALANTAYAENRPGEALREYLWLSEMHELPESSRGRLAGLLVQRGEERLALADADALADLAHAQGLGAAVPATVLTKAYLLCAVAALRHSSEFRHPRAAHCLAQLGPESVYRKHDQWATLDLGELEKLWDWYATAGAKKQALHAAQAYVDRGGRDVSRLGAWRMLHRWWYGDTRPLLPVGAALEAGPEPGPWLRFQDAVARYQHVPSATPLGLAADWEASEWTQALAEIIDGYQVDPALADRRAAVFIDSSAYGARESAILSELFFRLGDKTRARIWAERLVAIAPGLPASQQAAGLANAYAGDVGRADEFFVAASAASGDAGADWALAAMTYRRVEQPLAAVAAGRRSLGLTARGWDMHVLLEVSLAQSALGRASQADVTFDALIARFPLADRASARALVDQVRNAKGTDRLHTLLGPIRHSLGFSPATPR